VAALAEGDLKTAFLDVLCLIVMLPADCELPAAGTTPKDRMMTKWRLLVG
jgi:hypothetical protein